MERIGVAPESTGFPEGAQTMKGVKGTVAGQFTLTDVDTFWLLWRSDQHQFSHMMDVRIFLVHRLQFGKEILIPWNL